MAQEPVQIWSGNGVEQRVILVPLLTLQQQQAVIIFGIFLHNDVLMIKHWSKYVMRGFLIIIIIIYLF